MRDAGRSARARPSTCLGWTWTRGCSSSSGREGEGGRERGGGGLIAGLRVFRIYDHLRNIFTPARLIVFFFILRIYFARVVPRAVTVTLDAFETTAAGGVAAGAVACDSEQQRMLGDYSDEEECLGEWGPSVPWEVDLSSREDFDQTLDDALERTLAVMKGVEICIQRVWQDGASPR